MSVRLRRWRGAVAATIVLAVLGFGFRSGTLLIAATIPLAYVAYGSASRVRVPEELTATRTIEPVPAPPGRVVTVTLTLTNGSDRTVPDVRIADGVHEDVAVLEGSPRGGTTLEPGEELVVRYAVVARRGEYDFDPPQVRVRGLGAGAVATTSARTSGDRTLVCRLDADAPPLEETGDDRIGQFTADRPGTGLSFHSIRDHHPEDPAQRIDWRHYAKRGELATVNYDRQVAATVVLVVDAGEPNRVVAGRGRPTGVELAAYAATHALTDLLATGHEVGVAVVGLDGPDQAGLHWLAPGDGRGQRARGLEHFRRATAVEPRNDGERARAVDAATQFRTVLDRAPRNAQVALFSPLLDDAPVEGVETWRAAGLSTVVLAPDVVPDNTVSGQYATVRRRTRLARCQAAGVRTVDWRRGTPLPVVLERAFLADARLPSGRSSSRASGGGQ